MKEDYVSFETAKLLKEKGFDEDTICVYIGRHLLIKGESTISNATDMPIIPAPTLQMTMKWLREKYNIHIEIRYQGNKEYSYKYYINNLKADKEDNKHKFFGTHYMQPINENKTYESACESAIEYCLEHLI